MAQALMPSAAGLAYEVKNVFCSIFVCVLFFEKSFPHSQCIICKLVDGKATNYTVKFFNQLNFIVFLLV